MKANKIMPRRGQQLRCVVQDCMNHVAGKDNFRCIRHSREYYLPWIKHMVIHKNNQPDLELAV